MRDFLRYCAERLLAAETNNSFYKLPTEHTLRMWKETSPDDFVYAAKVSRHITHMKKLKHSGEALSAFFERISVPGEKLSPILYQVPPRWHCNHYRLRPFLPKLPQEHGNAFEFRDLHRFDDRVYGASVETDTDFCILRVCRTAIAQEDHNGLCIRAAAQYR